ncbi:nitrilase-related carbon-nitrogen hydrolase [Thalassomonas sp. M1454]|uniref:nitrilase-related carbon-nitrogen hydrolase n=1 Tax=Thalassomonas sp. M1454 TaxID=2594477 RepID=UPI00118092E1|nr:nitrilase-related carbon-nitrogen hydrolase [Thalassomonas sp. M1454]TRX55011.1 hydrolase [Thalassomonas sp. M1454]
MIRVAAAQYQVTNDVQANLITSIRMIKEAAKCSPDLIVLPEFANHNSWYDDKAHCYDVSIDVDGDFAKQIAATAKEVNAYVVINSTVRRGNDIATGTSLLFSPEGELIAENDKQVLIGHENDFLEIAQQQGPIVDTKIGKLAMYSCMDGVINETPRCLSLRGAQILCNSLNSFAIDEGTLHIPVRAAENKVFIVAANKVGPLIPEEVLEPISAAINIPTKFLSGAGDSQIVAPDGTVLAIAGQGEEVIWADIDPEQAGDKARPDGTDIYQARRPELYQSFGENPEGQKLPEFNGAIDAKAATLSVNSVEQASNEIAKLIADDVKLICLPELFWQPNLNDLAKAHADSLAVVASLQTLAAEGVYIATSVIGKVGDKYQHQGVIVSSAGLVLTQGQVHASKRFDFSTLSDQFNTYQSEHGLLALTLEDDAIYPESYRLIAMQGTEVVFAPVNQQEAWQQSTGFIERASENRVNIIACSSKAEDSLICSLQKDFTIMTPWVEREFDGLLSQCEVHTNTDKNIGLIAEIHPQAAKNKVVSHRTHLIDNRPWQLMSAML